MTLLAANRRTVRGLMAKRSAAPSTSVVGQPVRCAPRLVMLASVAGRTRLLVGLARIVEDVVVVVAVGVPDPVALDQVDVADALQANTRQLGVLRPQAATSR